MWRAELKAMEKLDALEGRLAEDVVCEDNGEQSAAIVDTGGGDSEVKVRGTLLPRRGRTPGRGRSRWG